MDLTRDQYKNLYKVMALTRIFEEKASVWYEKSLVKEAPHQCLGQEAIGVGTCFDLTTEDQILPSLRSRAAFFAKGVDVETTLLAMAGKKRGPSKGHETSHHAAYPELGVLFGTGMVGSSISIGVGAALALKMQGKSNVVVIYFGDGASNRGDFHEALNLAAVWKLPAIFVCENNGIALSTAIEASMLNESIADRAVGYGIPGVSVDGSDLIAVIAASRQAIKRARSGEGPTLLECKVARLCPHVSFLTDNRCVEEVKALKEARDPMMLFEAHLLEKGFTAAELNELKADISYSLDTAVQKLSDEPMPDKEDIMAHVYAEEVKGS